MAKLKNRTPFAQAYNLPHEFNCTETECRCTKVKVPIRELDRTTGRFGVRQEERLVCQSLSFQPGEVLDVDERALSCPEIVAAKARRELVEVGGGCHVASAEGAADAHVNTAPASRRSQRLGRTESKVG